MTHMFKFTYSTEAEAWAACPAGVYGARVDPDGHGSFTLTFWY